MKIKNIAVFFLIGISFIFSNVNGTSVNTCLGAGSVTPSQPSDCFLHNQKNGTCCYVNIVTATINSTYCAIMYGSYIRPAALANFQTDIGALNGSQINCSSSFISFTSIAAFIFSIILF